MRTWKLVVYPAVIAVAVLFSAACGGSGEKAKPTGGPNPPQGAVETAKPTPTATPTPTPTATPVPPTATPVPTLKVEPYLFMVGCASKNMAVSFDAEDLRSLGAIPIGLIAGTGPGTGDDLLIVYPESRTAQRYQGCWALLGFSEKPAQDFEGSVTVVCDETYTLQQPLSDMDGVFFGAIVIAYNRDSSGLGSLKIVSPNGDQLSGDQYIDCSLIES